MKIVHISTNSKGGASIAAIRIHESLLKNKVDSKILFLDAPLKNIQESYNFSDSESRIKFNFFNFINKVNNKLISKFSDTQVVSSALSPFDLTTHPIVQDADIIHLHWVSKFINYDSFFKKINKPVFWTLHDMLPFSPGYHYTFGFDQKKYQSFLNKNFKIKSESLKNFERLTIVSPSMWLMSESINSELFSKYNHHNIKYPIDDNIFKLLDKKSCKKELGFDENEKIVLFVSENVNDSRKGLNYLLKIIDKLSQNKIKIVAVGSGEIQNNQVVNLGKISSLEKLNQIYSAADVFVIPSMQDNFPNTIIESMACGTPVVAFDNSGLIELIQDDYNGFIAKNQDSDSLFDAIQKTLNSKSISSIQCRNTILENCNNYKIAQNYINLYSSLIV